MCMVILTDQVICCIHIDPMYDPGRIPLIPDKCSRNDAGSLVDQRMIRVSGRRVYDHPFGFIHDQNIHLHTNIQPDIFCCNIQQFRIQHFHINLIPLIQLIICNLPTFTGSDDALKSSEYKSRKVVQILSRNLSNSSFYKYDRILFISFSFCFNQKIDCPYSKKGSDTQTRYRQLPHNSLIDRIRLNLL